MIIHKESGRFRLLLSQNKRSEDSFWLVGLFSVPFSASGPTLPHKLHAPVQNLASINRRLTKEGKAKNAVQSEGVVEVLQKGFFT